MLLVPKRSMYGSKHGKCDACIMQMDTGEVVAEEEFEILCLPSPIIASISGPALARSNHGFQLEAALVDPDKAQTPAVYKWVCKSGTSPCFSGTGRAEITGNSYTVDSMALKPGMYTFTVGFCVSSAPSSRAESRHCIISPHEHWAERSAFARTQVTVSKKERSAVSSIDVQVVDGSDSPPTGRIQLACAGLACRFPAAPANPNKPLAMEVCTTSAALYASLLQLWPSV